MSSPSGGSGEDGGEDDERILLTINGATYDVTDYAPVHPGEGHHDIYLEDYAGKDVTREFAYYHSKQDKPAPQQLLAKVDQKGAWKKVRLVRARGDDDHAGGDE